MRFSGIRTSNCLHSSNNNNNNFTTTTAKKTRIFCVRQETTTMIGRDNKAVVFFFRSGSFQACGEWGHLTFKDASYPSFLSLSPSPSLFYSPSLSLSLPVSISPFYLSLSNQLFKLKVKKLLRLRMS